MNKHISTYSYRFSTLSIFALNIVERFAPQHKPLISLIVPVYNVENYIREFLDSILQLEFKLKRIEVILVNDGSTDSSGDIAQEYQTSHPHIFRVVHQVNAGVSAARNTGLNLARGKWVSFPDPDDILPKDWLSAFMDEVKENRKGSLLGVVFPVILFHDGPCKHYTPHSLEKLYRKRRVFNTEDLDDYVLFQCNTAFLLKAQIEKLNLRFDERVKPCFEDSHFVNTLFIRSPGYRIIRSTKTRYIYRKRHDRSSLVGQSRKKKAWYGDQQIYGNLSLLHSAMRTYGKVPRYIQRTVLSDLSHLLVHVENQPRSFFPLDDQEYGLLQEVVLRIISIIDADVIWDLNIGAFSLGFKIGIIGRYKSLPVGENRAYIAAVDVQNRMLQIKFHTLPAALEPVSVVFGDEPAKIFSHRVVTSYLFEEPLFETHYVWVSAGWGAISVTIGDESVKTYLRGKNVDGIEFDTVPELYHKRAAPLFLTKEAQDLRENALSPLSAELYGQCWIFMDRTWSADDNAEHFYRWVSLIHPLRKIFFVLDEASPDWSRLLSEGFNLLPYGSNQHFCALANCAAVISSHVEVHTTGDIPRAWINDLVSYKFIYLQHGVLTGNFSRWLNEQSIDLMTTSSQREYESITSPTSNYRLGKKELRLTGFPRHDALLSRKQRHDTICIMPTWRLYLTNELAPDSSDQIPFEKSLYSQMWLNLLQDERLKTIAAAHGKRIVLKLHPLMEAFAEHWQLPDYIEVISPSDNGSYQESFAEAAVLVTDYSSVAFDAAYIDKPIVYFQFDRSDFGSGAHPYLPGYYDYDEHGFGPARTTIDETLDSIQTVLAGAEDAVYQERRQNFFAHKDGKCCERVYEEVISLVGM